MRTVVITIISLIVIAASMVGLAVSPAFQVSTLTVTGEHELTEAEVLEAAGVDEKTNVLLLSIGETESRLVANPWIAEATVTRSLPSTLTITIDERTVAAVAKAPGGYFVIGEDGTTLRSSAKDEGLPVIRGGHPASVGERSETIVGAARAAATWDDTVLAEKPVITVDGNGALAIELEGGVPVTYGDARQPEAKGVALAGVLRWAQQNHERVVSIDVRVPTAPSAELESRGGGQPSTEDAVPIDTGTATPTDNGPQP